MGTVSKTFPSMVREIIEKKIYNSKLIFIVVKMATKISLCGQSNWPECPSVNISSTSVTIGEKDNLVKLKKAEWNKLVSLIKQGKLKKS